MADRPKLQQCDELWGLCSDGRKLYCVESEKHSFKSSLMAYNISGPRAERKLLDYVDGRWFSRASGHPRIDRQSHRIYIPCGEDGVNVFRWQNNTLIGRTMRCMARAVSVAVNSVDTLFVCDNKERSVYLIQKSTDSVIRELRRPTQLEHETPWHVSVLAKTVLVCYGSNTLVKYPSDVPTAGELLQAPDGLVNVSSITTDGHSSFLVTDSDGDSVFILDEQGHLRHRIRTGTGEIQDCAVVGSQLWLGYRYGEIGVMAPE